MKHTYILPLLLLIATSCNVQQTPNSSSYPTQQFDEIPNLEYNENAGEVNENTDAAPNQNTDAAPTQDTIIPCKGALKAIRELQQDVDDPASFPGTTRLRIVSYNCENLYDTYDDPKTNDDEFTPNGIKRWTKNKYRDKLINVTKAIRAAGNGSMPAIIGLMEIENKTVLEDLRKQDIMKDQRYRYVHKDSPDARGIDVALFYQTDKMTLDTEKWYPVKTTPKGGRTRDILYAKFKLHNGENLHVFVNHWPSMREGEYESEPKRVAAAKVLRSVVDTINKFEATKANIVIMGDFNSKATQEAFETHLGVKKYNANSTAGLVDLMERYEANDNIGSHKYGKSWDVIDHMVVSRYMLNDKNNVFTTTNSGHICHAKFLLNQDKNGYYSPKRAFKGNDWTGGYSDHLPISMDLYIRK